MKKLSSVHAKNRQRIPKNFGFIRVAAGSPAVAIADCDANRKRILKLAKKAEDAEASLLVTPELSITGYTCGDLFHQKRLLDDAWQNVLALAKDMKSVFRGILIVGLPLEVEQTLFNCAAVIGEGRVLGIVPKSFLPNYKEFYERRWFSPASLAQGQVIEKSNQSIPFGIDLIFRHRLFDDFRFGVEICEDLWMPIPPSSHLVLGGARIIANLSASNEIVGKANYRRILVESQAGRCLAGYVYAGCGMAESTTDLVFGGHCMIAENGVILTESHPFANPEPLIFADIDLEKLSSERARTGTFSDSQEQQTSTSPRTWRTIAIDVHLHPIRQLVPAPSPSPFFPNQADAENRAKQIFATQVQGLRQRLEAARVRSVSIGISGGLDSTLALLVCCQVFDEMELPRSQIRALTMPGFGTTPQTLAQAKGLISALKVQGREIDIRELAFQEMRSLKHKPFGIPIEKLRLKDLEKKLRKKTGAQLKDLVFENVQARVRTNLLMNSGFVVGTGDLSEIAMGWSTYNADHMSMYNPNSGIPKTLAQALVAWYSERSAKSLQKILRSVLATDISPELLPRGKGEKNAQKTEAIIGPYELHDFFLFHFIRFGHSPEKILFLAKNTKFAKKYAPKDIEKWLKKFFERFFASQYKRSAVPDGPKVGSVALSPRGDWRMPSDVQAKAWLEHN